MVTGNQKRTLSVFIIVQCPNYCIHCFVFSVTSRHPQFIVLGVTAIRESFDSLLKDSSSHIIQLLKNFHHWSPVTPRLTDESSFLPWIFNISFKLELNVDNARLAAEEQPPKMSSWWHHCLDGTEHKTALHTQQFPFTYSFIYSLRSAVQQAGMI